MALTATTTRRAGLARSTPAPMAARPSRSQRSVVVAAAADGAAAAASSPSDAAAAAPPATAARRSALLALAASAAAALAPAALPAPARAEGEYATFLGYATPPTSYGGYGGNANEPPKYTFEYPAAWKQEVPSKVEKGTQGVDGRVAAQGRAGKDYRAFVITLGRAGEDNKSFKLTEDRESAFASFAGADYALQDALSGATNVTVAERTDAATGISFYDYDIDSPDFRYLSSIAVKGGKVFALFVRSPARGFGAMERDLRHIQETFKLL